MALRVGVGVAGWLPGSRPGFQALIPGRPVDPPGPSGEAEEGEDRSAQADLKRGWAQVAAPRAARKRRLIHPFRRPENRAPLAIAYCPRTRGSRIP